MSFAARRLEVAAALTEALTDTDTVIYPVLPTPLKAGSGWLRIQQADTEDLTHGEIARATYEVVVAVGTDSAGFEAKFDEIAAELIEACAGIGRGVYVKPLIFTIDSADFYCAVATLITEVEAS